MEPLRGLLSPLGFSFSSLQVLQSRIHGSDSTVAEILGHFGWPMYSRRNGPLAGYSSRAVA